VHSGFFGIHLRVETDRPGVALALSQGWGMCYNRKAVKDTGKQAMAPAGMQGAAVAKAPVGGQATDQLAARGLEDASRYCPVCSQRLESRRCKLVCGVCGYYMSCADYY